MTTAEHPESWLWAKTSRDEATKELTGWLPLPVHLRDTAEIARLLVRHRMSRQQRAVIEQALPGHVKLEDLAWLLGALHDTGKAGPNFQAQDQELADRLYRQTRALAGSPESALNTRDTEPINGQYEFPHSVASEAIVARVLAEQYGLTQAPPKRSASSMMLRAGRPLPRPIVYQLASIAGAHHGMTAADDTPRLYILGRPWPQRLGAPDSPWPAVQQRLVRTLIAESEIDFTSPEWHTPSVLMDVAALSLLTGLVIQADWIASNQGLFPVIGIEEDISACVPSAERARNAWDALQLPTLWTPVPKNDPDEALRSRFALPVQASARPGQLAAHAATIDLDEPALLILEDETGAGKTEAALLAAENLAAATGASGVFIGLPTQATANAMFARARTWAEQLGITGEEGSIVATSLAHSKASLNQDYSGMQRQTASRAETGEKAPSPETIQPSHMDASPVTEFVDQHSLPDDSHAGGNHGEDTTASAAASGASHSRARILRPGIHSWLAGGKKRLLSDFVIGTVDQLLMASMKARHLMLRHSGLADKVVIIDEAHAADTTMRTFMRSALVWLGRWGVPTIVLTATLPPGQRSALIDAYRKGLALRAGHAAGENAPLKQQGTAPEAAPGPSATASSLTNGDERVISPDPDEAVYPALTVATDSAVQQIPFRGRPPRSVRLHELDDDDSALLRTVHTLTRSGGCIAVIRNSVRRVQATAKLLREEFGEEVVTVAHARFAAADRAERDRWMLRRFGKDGAERPAFSIIVASQVIEQSLDVDFDAVITDMCPVDLLVQRLGRVHRHSGRTRPESLQEPVCYLTGVEDWSAEPPELESESKNVYGSHLLLRSIAAVREVCGQNGSLTTPTDVPALVHRVYSERSLGPEEWQPALTQAAQDQARKDTEATTLAARWVTEPDKADFGLDGWLNANDGDVEDSDPYNRERGHVRDGSESIEVLLVLSDGTGWRTLDWLPRAAGRPLPDGDVPRHIAEAVANSSVRLPFAMSQGTAGDAVIMELEKLGRPEFQRSSLLRGQLILPLQDTGSPAPSGRDYAEEYVTTGSAQTTYAARVGDWTITYDRTDGLDAHRQPRS